MKNKLNVCETFQLSISDKYDESLTLNHSENDHLESCAECQQFYQFVHGKSFQEMAQTPADKAFALEGVTQADVIMKLLTTDEPVPVKKSNVIRITLASAAVAAIAAVTISQVVQPANVEGDSEAIVQAEMTPKKKVALPVLAMPSIKLDEQYSAINSVVEGRIETVTYSIDKLRACFIEGNAFLDEHTQSNPEVSPESYYSVESKHATIS